MRETGSDKRRPLVLRWRTTLLNSSEPASVKLTLLALAEHATPDGKRCFPSAETLATCTSQHEKTCRRALDSADGKWFTRSPIKLQGRSWRGYNYTLVIPDGPDMVSATHPEGAGTVSATQEPSSGHLPHEVRTLTPEGAGTVSDELEKATRKSNKEEAPAADAAVPRKSANGKTTFTQWIDSLPDLENAIPGNDPIFRYADKVGLSREMLELHWLVFSERYEGNPKRYADWRAVFRNSVKGSWFKLWFIDDAGHYTLTTQGKQADRQYRSIVTAANQPSQLPRLQA